MLKGADTAPKKSAMNSRRKKYLQFALKYKDEIPSLIPIFPLDLGNLMRYVLYLASDEGNVKAGWSSCSNFVSEIIIMGKLRGWEDPREGARNKFLWDRFRQNFRTQVQVVRKAPRKLRMTPAHLQAIVATMDLDTFNGLRWATAFVTLWHSNARVGHVAPKSARHTDHVWKYEDLVFAPSLAKAETVLIHFRSTKTRAAKEDRSFWTALGKVELKKGQPNTCPVRLLQAWVQSSYTGNPKDPLFGQGHDTSTPIVRAQFTSKLRQSLEEGAKFLAPPHNKLNPKAFSGVSFRKGSLSAMSGTVEFNRLRERADHKCPESTSHYVSDSVQTRAQSSLDVHARFGRAQEHRKEEQSEHTLWIIPVWHSDFPKHAHAQVMITTGMPTENEMTEDKMQHVTLQKRSKARVEDRQPGAQRGTKQADKGSGGAYMGKWQARGGSMAGHGAKSKGRQVDQPNTGRHSSSSALHKRYSREFIQDNSSSGRATNRKGKEHHRHPSVGNGVLHKHMQDGGQCGTQRRTSMGRGVQVSRRMGTRKELGIT